MAAETLTGTRAASNFPVRTSGLADNVKVAWGTYAVAANVEDGDIFEMCKIPKNSAIIGGFFASGDLDTGTEAIDLDVGWAANGGDATFDVAGTSYTNSGNTADPDGLANMGVLTGDAITDLLAAGSNLRLFPMATGPLYFSAETMIQVEANVAAATFAAGTIYVCVFYTMLS
jgi:hypothetical protein